METKKPDAIIQVRGEEMGKKGSFQSSEGELVRITNSVVGKKGMKECC